MHLTTSLLLLLTTRLSAAYGVGIAETCVDACQTAVSSITFPDSYASYYDNICKSKRLLESVSLCSQLYCSSEEIVEGNEYLNNTCEINIGVSLPPYQPNKKLSRNQLRRMAINSRKAFETLASDNPVIPPPETFHLTFKTVGTFAYETRTHQRYGSAMWMFWGAVVAISMATKAFILLHSSTSRRVRQDVEKHETVQSQPRKQNIVGKLKVKINYFLLTPATIGRRSVEPYWWCTVPPLIQSLTIMAFIAVNVILCALTYVAFDGNTYYPDKSLQLWRYFSDRTGFLAFANLPILWLFGTRNNLLLWLTGWGPSTFNSFHRWVARVATLEAVLHSIGYTAFSFLEGGKADFDSSWLEAYWRWGNAATIAMSLLLGLSVYGFRKNFYDLFLAIHIVFAVVILVACFYHVNIFTGGPYNGYLWACVAVWVLDRLLRVVRVVSLNFNRFSKSHQATVVYSEDSNMVRLEVPVSLSAAKFGSSYYVYVLHGWTWFQSHPFTSSFAFSPGDGAVTRIEGNDTTLHETTNKDISTIDETSSSNSSEIGQGSVDHSRLRFYIRPYKGFTSRLRALALLGEPRGVRNLRVLVEGPYGVKESIHIFDNVMFVVGGSGITVVLQYFQDLMARKSADPSFRLPRLHLLWAIRQPSLLAEFRTEMKTYERLLGAKLTIHATGDRNFSVVGSEKADAYAGLEIEGWTVLRGRPDIEEAVLSERQGCAGSFAVISCAPTAMTDQTRSAAVTAMRKTQSDIKYIQESFSW